MYLKPDSKWSPSGPEVVPVHSTNAMLPNSRMKKVESSHCTGCLNEALPIVGKMWRRSDTSVLFFRLSVFYFASGHASTVFLHFVVKIDIRWRNRHPLSLSVGRTCFLMTFYVILKQISNYCFCYFFAWPICLCYFLRFSQPSHCPIWHLTSDKT